MWNKRKNSESGEDDNLVRAAIWCWLVKVPILPDRWILTGTNQLRQSSRAVYINFNLKIINQSTDCSPKC